MLVVSEIWPDLSEDGQATCLRLSVSAENAQCFNFHKGDRVVIALSGPTEAIGGMVCDYIAFIKGKAILEVVELLPVGCEAQHPWPFLPAMSVQQLVKL